MRTVLAIETAGSAAVAGDRRTPDGTTVTSESATRLFDLAVGDVGAGAVGEAAENEGIR